MTIRLKTKLTVCFTAIALAAVPATAFAGNSWKTTDLHTRGHHRSAHHYIERGRNWN